MGTVCGLQLGNTADISNASVDPWQNGKLCYVEFTQMHYFQVDIYHFNDILSRAFKEPSCVDILH